ncbi:MAG: hypothetical protein ACTSVU_10135, partial [Promethearchaeota archaeon]
KKEIEQQGLAALQAGENYIKQENYGLAAEAFIQAINLLKDAGWSNNKLQYVQMIMDKISPAIEATRSREFHAPPPAPEEYIPTFAKTRQNDYITHKSSQTDHQEDFNRQSEYVPTFAKTEQQDYITASKRLSSQTQRVDQSNENRQIVHKPSLISPEYQYISPNQSSKPVKQTENNIKNNIKIDVSELKSLIQAARGKNVPKPVAPAVDTNEIKGAPTLNKNLQSLALKAAILPSAQSDSQKKEKEVSIRKNLALDIKRLLSHSKTEKNTGSEMEKPPVGSTGKQLEKPPIKADLQPKIEENPHLKPTPIQKEHYSSPGLKQSNKYNIRKPSYESTNGSKNQPSSSSANDEDKVDLSELQKMIQNAAKKQKQDKK